MTFSPDIALPFHKELISSNDGEDRLKYMRELVTQLQDELRALRRDIDGYYSWSENSNGQGEYWLPAVYGTTVAGVGTYAANKQVGIARRAGYLVDVFFDVTWTGHTGTGNLYVELPYKPIEAQEKPFVGVIQDSNITYTAGTRLVINAIPDTFRGEIWTCGGGVATGNQGIVTSGQLIGHIRYIGQFYEQ